MNTHAYASLRLLLVAVLVLWGAAAWARTRGGSVVACLALLPTLATEWGTTAPYSSGAETLCGTLASGEAGA